MNSSDFIFRHPNLERGNLFKSLEEDVKIIAKNMITKIKIRVKSFNQLGWKRTIGVEYQLSWNMGMDKYISREFKVDLPAYYYGKGYGKLYLISPYYFHEDWVEVL